MKEKIDNEKIKSNKPISIGDKILIREFILLMDDLNDLKLTLKFIIDYIKTKQ